VFAATSQRVSLAWLFLTKGPHLERATIRLTATKKPEFSSLLRFISFIHLCCCLQTDSREKTPCQRTSQDWKAIPL
jgi:hypothetical protein